MAYNNDTGEWEDDAYGEGNGGDWGPYAHDFDPTHGDSSGDARIYDTTPSDNADDHGKIDQPSSGGGGGGQKSEEDMKKELGGLYTPGAYEEYQHHDFDPGWYDRIINKENLRADNEVGSEYHENGSGGYLTGPKTGQASSSLLGRFSGGGSGSSGGTGKGDEVYGYLKGLFPGGALNTDVMNRRLDSVRSGLNAQRQSTTKNNQAYLADRGLAGSGPEATANENLESRLFGQFGSAYNDIYADESQNADNRMMTALTTAAGMSEGEAERAIAQFRANTERDLGFGNLALGNKTADNNFTLGSGNLALGNSKNTNDYNLGAGRLQLDREQLEEIIRSGDSDRLLKYLEMLQRGAETSSNGHY